VNIRTKLLGGFLSVWVGLSAVLLYVNFQHDRDARDRSDQIAANLTSDVVANALIQSMAAAHKGAEVPPLLNAMAQARGFQWAEVTDMSGRPVWSSGSVPADREPNHRLIAAASVSGTASAATSDGLMVARLLPRQAVCVRCHGDAGRWVGAALIESGVDPPLLRAQSEANLLLLVLTLGIGGVGSLSIWLILNRSLVRPLSAMTARVQAITPHNWTATRISPVAQGEVGVLASHFNGMLDRLARAADERESILRTALDGFAAVDIQGRILDVNDAYCQLHGYSRAELLSLTVADLRAAEQQPDVRADLERIVAKGGDRFETRHRRKDGRLVDVEVSANHTGDGHIFVFLRDITARHAAEARLSRSEAQLRQSQKMEAVGRLAGGIAHDFNNLLTAILGFSELGLEHLSAHDPGRADFEEIKKAGMRAAALTRQLLVFSRKQVLELKVRDISAIVRDTKNMLRRLIGENIELSVVTDASPACATVDQGHMEQVILNLAINARDAMPNGGQLTIEVHTMDLPAPYAHAHGTVPQGRYVVLSVTDTGGGMRAEVQARLFEPFFTTKERGKGTGLGLSTVYGIVTQIDGHIAVDSELGRGTSFQVYLPSVEGAAGMAAMLESAAPVSVDTAVILLVEDDALVRHLTSRALIRDGFTVLEAGTGEDALTLCQRHNGPIHLLLTDMVLPKMPGPDVAAHVTALRPEIRVLFMSGYSDHALFAAHLRDGGKAFIQKPFSLKALIQKIRTALATPRETTEPAHP